MTKIYVISVRVSPLGPERMLVEDTTANDWWGGGRLVIPAGGDIVSRPDSREQGPEGEEDGMAERETGMACSQLIVT
jgi:hypothetical protein